MANALGDTGVLEFMLIIGNLKKNKRTGWVIRDVPAPESVADHMYRMAILAMLLEEKSQENGNAAAKIIDKTRCIKVALVHDMCEAIVGDITPYCGVSVEDKHRQEKEAMISMCQNLKKEVADEILSLYEEYENQVTVEAQTVKDLDRFEMILQAYEYELSQQRADNPQYLEEFFASTKGKFKNPQVVRWVKKLTEMRDVFHSPSRNGTPEVPNGGSSNLVNGHTPASGKTVP
ncbi:putative HD domain-containing protein 2 [Hypsibius exemplaris]|uniref:5'-deoxynucleotidase HDDC2 n=1 Tax=Hypsibius exemplaris TaxID=2072580 RepID=A0A1W0WQM5_HYPEX|nr:putative HD domain-containing protein 2 [Hypsibius exemplaris]